MSKVKPQITTLQLIRRLRLMADTGGMLTKDRIEVARQAADRLEEYDERIAIMTESGHIPTDNNYFGVR